MKLNFSKLLVKTQNIKVIKEIKDQGKLQTRYKNAENVFGKKLKLNRNIFLKNAELKNGNATKTLKKKRNKRMRIFQNVCYALVSSALLSILKVLYKYLTFLIYLYKYQASFHV